MEFIEEIEEIANAKPKEEKLSELEKANKLIQEEKVNIVTGMNGILVKYSTAWILIIPLAVLRSISSSRSKRVTIRRQH